MANDSVKGVIKNFILNFLSFALPTVVLQFVVQPLIAAKLGGDLNGQYLTLMSLNFFLIGISATVLNTVRMLQNEKYEKNNVVGDFNIIFLFYALLLILIMPLGYLLYVKDTNIIDILLYVLIGILYLYHDYIFAQYRLRMQFNKILINNGILIVGYAIGTFLFMFVLPKWQFVFICAYVLTGIYDFANTTFIREPLKKTEFFSETVKKVGSLMVANSLNSSIAYFDKLLLFPLLGGVAVSVYNTASLVGKMLYLVSFPLNSLLLSYLVKIKRFRLASVKKYIFRTVVVLILGYIVCVLVGYPLTDLLYPLWASESHIFIPITVASNLFLLISELINTVLLRYYKISFQMIIQSVNLVMYLGVSLVAMYFWGLLGFSIGVSIVALIKTVVMLIIIIRLDKKQEQIV